MIIQRDLYQAAAVTLLTSIDETHAVEMVEDDTDRCWHIRLNRTDPRQLAVYRVTYDGRVWYYGCDGGAVGLISGPCALVP